MRRGGWAFFGLVLLALSLRGLDVLQRLTRLPARAPARVPSAIPRRPPPPPPTLPAPPSADEAPAPSADPSSDAYRPRVGSRRHFERRDSEWAHTLTYGFVDHHGREQSVTCDISRVEHESQVAQYGFEPADIDRRVDERLRPMVERELESRGLSSVVRLHFKGGGAYEAKSSFPEGTTASEGERLAGEVRRFYQWLDGGFETERQRVEQSLYAQRGIRLEGRRLTPDHVALAARASRPLADCFRALARASSSDSDRRRLGLFLAFLQEIPYEVPPDRLDGREILGLLVPTEVLVGRHGDCDSKSVTLAALWRNLDAPILLISLPRHMLVGVAVAPGPGEHYVQIGNRYFVLCEVAGPGKVHPGREPIPRSFEYVLIEPAASGRPATRGRSS